MSRALATVVKAFRTDGGMCCRYWLVLARASRDAALRVWQLAGAAARLKDAVRVAGIAFDVGRDVADCLIRPEVALGAAACGDVLADGTGLACGSPGMIAAPGVVAPTAAGQMLEWITSSGKASEAIKLPSGRPLTVRIDLDLGAAPPLFQRGYLSRMTCVQEIAR